MAENVVNRVELDLRGKMHFEAKSGRPGTVALDAGIEHGGTGEGFSPMDLLLVGLGGCTAMDVFSIMAKKRQEITNYRVEVEGDRSGGYPNVFSRIRIKHIVHGNNLSPESLARSIELSEFKYCPAYAMLGKSAEISSSYEIHQTAPAD